MKLFYLYLSVCLMTCVDLSWYLGNHEREEEHVHLISHPSITHSATSDMTT